MWPPVLEQDARARRAAAGSRPAALAHLLTAAFQGGALPDQAAEDSTPLRDALHGALAYIESFAAEG